MQPFYKKIFVTFIVVVGILAVNFFVFDSFLEDAIFAIGRPVFGGLTSKASDTSSYFRNLLQASDLGNQVTTLEEENRKLLNLVARLEQLQAENEVLRARLNLGIDHRAELVFAGIFSIRGNGAQTSFLINKGSADGVEEGLAVVTAENTLAGVVGKAYKNTALVLMPQNKDLALNVKVNGTQTLARSQSNGQRVILDFVTSQDELKTDDLVVTSGLDRIPEAIPVFKITEVRPVQGNLFQEVTVIPVFDVLKTSKVFIIK